MIERITILKIKCDTPNCLSEVEIERNGILSKQGNAWFAKNWETDIDLEASRATNKSVIKHMCSRCVKVKALPKSSNCHYCQCSLAPEEKIYGICSDCECPK